MNYLISSVFLIGLFLSRVCGAADSDKELSYSLSKFKVGTEKRSEKISIDKVVINSASFLDQSTIKRINISLAKVSQDLYRTGLDCYESRQSNPWGYEVKFDEYYRYKDFLSVIFKTFSVCSGNPYMGKTGVTFSVKTGRIITTKELLEQLSPKLLTNGTKIDHDFLELGEEAGDEFISDHADQFLPNLLPICDWYIKRAGFKVWPNKTGLVLHPVFQQPYSLCYKDYLQKFDSSK